MTCPEDHVGCDPDVCFTAKLRYMRASGGLALGFTYGKGDFHGPTIKERGDRMISEAKANGLDPSPVGARWV